jgi:hypothetical protein
MNHEDVKQKLARILKLNPDGYRWEYILTKLVIKYEELEREKEELFMQLIEAEAKKLGL